MPTTRTPQLQLRAPARPKELEAPPLRELLPPAPQLLELEPGPEHQDGDFPPHMLRWVIVGVLAYVAAIAAGMLYGAILAAAAR